MAIASIPLNSTALFRMKLLLILFTLLFFLSPSLKSYAVSCETAKEAMEKAEKIRGLKRLKSVPCHIHSKTQVEAFIRETIKKKIPPQKLENEEIVFKAIGLIPASFSYKNDLIDLYLSQLGGYYDPDRDHFVMAGWMPEMMQPMIAAHELTHALQDQYFNLNTFLDEKKQTTDQQLARMALVEGDATLVMLDYMRALTGQGGIINDSNVNSLMMQNALGGVLTSSTTNIPQALQMLLLFPYTSGARFAHHYLRVGNGYQELNKLFKSPPQSTEEILHPEKYSSSTKEFSEIDESEIKNQIEDGQNFKIIYSDTLGEFVISLLLGNFNQDKLKAAQAAAGWGGDKIALLEKGKSKKIVWITKWDTVEDRAQFIDAYSPALNQKRVLRKTEERGGEEKSVILIVDVG
jgi:hypothetical protein